jgi:hypothetical protein
VIELLTVNLRPDSALESLKTPLKPAGTKSRFAQLVTVIDAAFARYKIEAST